MKDIEERVAPLTQGELLDLISRLTEIAKAKSAQPRPSIDWSRYAGVLKHGPDPIEYQRQIRADWDDRS